MNRKTIGVGVAVLVVALGSTTWAQGPGPDGGKREGMRPERHAGPAIGRLLERPGVMEKIGLTAEQAQAIRDKMFELRKREITARAELELAAMEQARLLTEDNVDEEALMKAVEKTAAFRTELAKLRMKHVLLLKTNLDEEQRTKLRRLMRRREEHGEDDPRGDRRGPRRREKGRKSEDRPEHQ